MSLSRIATALGIFVSTYSLLHYYIWTRLIRDPAMVEPWARIVTWALIALALSAPLSLVAMRLLKREVVAPMAWVAYTWMGVFFFLVVVLFTFDIARWLSGPFVGPPADAERRVALSRAFAAMAGTTAALLSGAALVSGLSRVGVRRVRVALTKFPPLMSGFKIVQLTDIHVGPTIGREFIEYLVRATNALEPDLIAITGDLVDGSVADLGALVEPLRGLRARHGVYFVTGNHEYYSGADEWIAFLHTLGIRVLRNERVAIGGDAGFDLAGVDDSAASGNGHGIDIPKAMHGRDPARAVVLLAHQPKAIKAAGLAGVDLQLSGHTHGGQLFPFNFLVKIDQPYVAGLSDHGATQIYVSRGTGYWGPPMRLGAPAEITEIELTAVPG